MLKQKLVWFIRLIEICAHGIVVNCHLLFLTSSSLSEHSPVVQLLVAAGLHILTQAYYVKTEMHKTCESMNIISFTC